MSQYLAWYILCGIPIVGFLHCYFDGDVNSEEYRRDLASFGLVLFSIVCYPITLVISLWVMWESVGGNK